MRNLLLTLVPTVALMASPAFAQSSESTSETTTTTTGAAPVTSSKEVHKSESTPGGDRQVEAKSQQTVNPDGTVDTTTQKHAEVNGVDGSHAESTTTTSSGPN